MISLGVTARAQDGKTESLEALPPPAGVSMPPSQPSPAAAVPTPATLTGILTEQDLEEFGDPTTTPAILKGFIPDLERNRLMQEAVDEERAAREKKEKAAAATRAKAKASVSVSTSGTKTVVTKKNEPAPKTTAKVDDKALEEAQEAADRANGIVRSSKTAEAKPGILPSLDGSKKSGTTAKLDTDKLPEPLDDKKPLEKTASKKPAVADSEKTETAERTGVKTVPASDGRGVSVKTTEPAKDREISTSAIDQDLPEIAQSEKPKGYFEARGTVLSMKVGDKGKLRVLVNSQVGLVEGVIDPTVGARVPMPGSSVTLRGKKVGGNNRTTVMRVDSITRGITSASSSSRSTQENRTSKRYESDSQDSRAPTRQGFIPGGPVPFPPVAGPIMMGPPPMMGPPILGPPPPPFF